MKKLIFGLIFLFVLFPIDVNAENDYEITSYNVDIKVNENNSYDVTETIGVHFNVPRHGIILYIPARIEVERSDGTKYINRARITDIKGSNISFIGFEGIQKVIQIGDPDYYASDYMMYTISYHYEIDNDKNEGYDEMYFTIINSDWDTLISNVSFNITMPKDFDENKLEFFDTKLETNNTKNTDIKYNISGKRITGYLTDNLKASEGLSIRLELDEGYFTEANNFNFPLFMAFVLPITVLFICMIILYKRKNDPNVVETIEFYPPKTLNSLEVAYAYKGSVDRKDVISLLIYLANKGYLTINQLSNEDYIITKLKSYDGNNKAEEAFMHGLFLYKTSVTKEDINDYFCDNIDHVISLVYAEDGKKKLFEKNKFIKYILIFILLMILYMLSFGQGLLNYGSLNSKVILLIGALTFGLMTINAYLKMGRKLYYFAILLLTIIYFGPDMYPGLLESIVVEPTYISVYLFGILSITSLILVMINLNNRTLYGKEVLGKIKGFKNFLETTKKAELETLVMKNPTYFYDILPFTYVLDISDTWINQFEGLTYEKPQWFIGSSQFNFATYNRFINASIARRRRDRSSGGFHGGHNGKSTGLGSSGGGRSW